MARSPDWKVYHDGEYRAAVKYIEDAAILVAALGKGASIRCGHSKTWTVWVEGEEGQSAGESYDHVARVAHARAAAFRDRGGSEAHRAADQRARSVRSSVGAASVK